MVDENKNLNKGIIWFDDIRNTPNLIASVVRTWLLDKVPQELYDEADKLKDLYTAQRQEGEIEEVFVNTLFEGRRKSMKEAVEQFKSELNKEEEKAE